MTMQRYCLAIDIGAASGRHIVGWEEDGQIKTDEVFRFPNGAKRVNGHLVWEIEKLYENVVEGIRKAFGKYPAIDSIAIDTWGVDYVLMRGNKQASPCFSNRDERTQAIIGEVHDRISFETLYEHTGIQFQPFNTIYQLYEDKKAGRLQGVTDFLMVPEYLNFCLTGVKKHEYANVTTTGLVNAQTADYDKEIISALGLPAELFKQLYPAGSTVGTLKPEIAEAMGATAKSFSALRMIRQVRWKAFPCKANSPTYLRERGLCSGSRARRRTPTPTAEEGTGPTKSASVTSAIRKTSWGSGWCNCSKKNYVPINLSLRSPKRREKVNFSITSTSTTTRFCLRRA